MMEMIEANWPLLLVAFLIGLAIAWFLFNASRRTKVTGERKDVLDEGAAPAARNQALIDSAPAASAAPSPSPAPTASATPKEAPSTVPPATPMGLAGTGAAVSASVEDAQETRAEEIVDTPSSTETPAPAQPQAPAPAPTAASPTPDGKDDLTRLKGVGPKLATALEGLGITSLETIANWDDAQIDRVDSKLGRFQGRIRRDDWVTQARLLTDGDKAAYEASFGRID